MGVVNIKFLLMQTRSRGAPPGLWDLDIVASMAGGLGSSCTCVPNGHFRRGSRTTLRRGGGAATRASQRALQAWQQIGAGAGGLGSCTCIPKGIAGVAAGRRARAIEGLG